MADLSYCKQSAPTLDSSYQNHYTQISDPVNNFNFSQAQKVSSSHNKILGLRHSSVPKFHGEYSIFAWPYLA